ncbi:type II toxin-antitoxin system Phd/YefM family antitoxin [Lentilactobacillus fungorum]|uniref:Antitoxin n=1 Tax=Lentilactobacillus fungorum TaxID=2201250 RepID=A0ABQ3VZ04_9LACO|nr:type II toxin-antitoxin system Phd/YefM family antitoxin [Lentilactobacillus fungorum]GHP14137.1 type II toxin-antitoxin system Phd/YefM family antitoxin [Lentilactobacillus fungorum]
MENYTPTKARKNFFQLIKDVNIQKKPVIITPANGNEDEAAVLVSKKDWDSMAETIYLEATGELPVARQREKDDQTFIDVDDIDWDNL